MKFKNFFPIIFLALTWRTILFFKAEYFKNIDTYAYLNRDILVDNTLLGFSMKYLGLYFTLALMTVVFILTLFLFYKIIEHLTNEKTAFIFTLIFSLSPLVFSNTDFRVIDKNIFVLFNIVLLLWYFVCYIKHEKIIKTVILNSLIIVLTIFIWEGFILLLIIPVTYYILRLFSKDHIVFFVVIISILTLMFAFSLEKLRILTLNFKGKGLIMETRYIWQSSFKLEYFILFFVFVITIGLLILSLYYYSLKNNDRFLIILFLIYLILSVYMVRFIVLLLPLLYILFAKIYYHNKKLRLFSISMVIICFSFGSNAYFTAPVMDDLMLDAINYADSLNSSCIISNWGNGHILDYYSEKEILYKAHPTYYKQELSYFVYENMTNCTLLWTERDFSAWEYMLINDGVNVTGKEFYIYTINNTQAKCFENNLSYVCVR